MTPEAEPSEDEETEVTCEAELAIVSGEAIKSSVGSLEPLSKICMHPNDILKALKAFVHEIKKLREKHPPVKKAPEERDDSKDSEYWEALAHIIPDGKLKLWDALIVGLQKYHHILSQRDKLITETDGLHQQNAELRLLLQQYLQSPVNAELLIPPTHLLNMQLNSS